MRVKSVRVGSPKQIEFGGRSTLSAICKVEVDGEVDVRRLGLEGDNQVESGHGGEYKALYGYSTLGYAYWQRELVRDNLPAGAFGENLTLDGLVDAEVCSGDRLRVGTAILVATTPRIPCYKLEIRMEEPELIARYLASDWPGIYFMVETEGVVKAGDDFEWLSKESAGVSIVELMRIYSGAQKDPAQLEKVMNLVTIPSQWRDRIGAYMQRSGQFSA